jgi:hypothetical protein
MLEIVFDYSLTGPVVARITGAPAAEAIKDWLRAGGGVLHENRAGTWSLTWRDPDGHVQVQALKAERDPGAAAERARVILSRSNAVPAAQTRASGGGTVPHAGAAGQAG